MHHCKLLLWILQHFIIDTLRSNYICTSLDYIQIIKYLHLYNSANVQVYYSSFHKKKIFNIITFMLLIQGCWQCCPHNGSVHALVQFVKFITLIHLKSAHHNKIWYWQGINIEWPLIQNFDKYHFKLKSNISWYSSFPV